MSDSGRCIGDCKHGYTREVCSICRIEELTVAIKKHHDQHADDLCWMDDDELYAVAGLPARHATTGDPKAMLRNCKRFIRQRCQGAGDWKSYAELEAELAKAQAELDYECPDCETTLHSCISQDGCIACEAIKSRDTIAKLQAENAKLRADKERLDWLESHIKADGWEHVLIEDDGVVSACKSGYPTGWHTETIRAAIDAAKAT